LENVVGSCATPRAAGAGERVERAR
jgi:hypothetical protein